MTKYLCDVIDTQRNLLSNIELIVKLNPEAKWGRATSIKNTYILVIPHKVPT